MKTADSVIYDPTGRECVFDLVCMTGTSEQFPSFLYIHFFNPAAYFHPLFHIILSAVVFNISHVLPARTTLQITALCSFKVVWISSFSDSVLKDDVCLTRFCFHFGGGGGFQGCR